MTTPAFVVPPLRLSESDEDRLREYGLCPEQVPAAPTPSSPGRGGDEPTTPTTPTGPEGADDPTTRTGQALSTAISATTATGRGGVIVMDRGRDDRLWKRDPVALVDAATSAAAECATDSPLVMVLLPASVPPRRGPVAVLSPRRVRRHRTRWWWGPRSRRRRGAGSSTSTAGVSPGRWYPPSSSGQPDPHLIRRAVRPPPPGPRSRPAWTADRCRFRTWGTGCTTGSRTRTRTRGSPPASPAATTRHV